MVVESNELEVIRVSSPCRVSWKGMTGDDQVRFCEQCKLNVYNLSAMTRAAATDLVKEREGRVCVRFYRRRDGTVVTRECELSKQGFLGKVATAIAVTFSFLTLNGCQTLQGSICIDRDGQSSTNVGVDDAVGNDDPQFDE